MGYSVITLDTNKLFINKENLEHEAGQTLIANKVEICNYEDAENQISKITLGSSVYMDINKINTKIYNRIPKDCKVIEGVNLTTNLKAIKNDIEIKNLTNCQIRDGVAMVNFIHWLKTSISKEHITEIDLAHKLLEFRKEQRDYVGLSFNPIIGYKDHAAMMHYEPRKDSQYSLAREGMVLVDSGGQYLDGTTDITRTIALGNLTDQEKKDFTLVLKGHISLIKAKFLYGATGANLDVLARIPLWQEAIDYKCGTGHGVGYFLNVHEGPQGFSQFNTVKLEENMILTVEPGIYREGSHGVRTENTVLVCQNKITEFGKFMKFKVISYCPIDLDAIDVNILDEGERKWLNEYHQDVYEKISPYVSDDVELWLKENTKPI